MKYPFYICTKCDYEIKEMSFPISKNEVYPECPRYQSNDNVDIVIGNENTVLDSNMVIFRD